MTSGDAYGEKLVNFMLKREQVFVQFRSCYYLLYQCLVPNTREALSLLVQHYSVPKDFERSILSGENPRVCNQGILNYLLIKLRTDKNFAKFWDALRSMINHPELRLAVGRIQKCVHTISKGSTQSSSVPRCDDITSRRSSTGDHDMEDAFPLHGGALSVTDSDDDYCVSYIVTMVDVRSCTRPHRSHDHLPTKATTSVADEDTMSSLSVAQQMLINNSSFAELQSHYSVLVRSMPDDYMNTVSQLERHLTGDHIGSILECGDVFTANQRILDCLIEQLENKEDTFDLCDKLSVITDAPLLTAAIEDLKIDVINSLKSGDTSDSSITNGVNMDSSINRTPNNLSNSTAIVTTVPDRKLVPGIFYKLRPGQYSPRALAILQKHYHTLWRSFPNDHMITLTTLCEIFKISDDIIDMITSKPTFEEANRVMLDYVIFCTNGDQQMNAFCDLMVKIIDNPKLSKVTGNLRKDCMDIVVQNMLQSILQRNRLTSTSSSNQAHIEELPSDTTFSEDVAVVTTESSTVGDQQDGGDIGAAVIEHLPVGVSVQCRTMLHSYYDTLWQSFPQDHLITLSRLCNFLPVEERLVETVALYPTSRHDVANRRILNAALSNVKRDNELLGFCVLIEKLIADPDKAKTVENLKSDCLRVIEKKQDLVKPSSAQEEQVADEVTPNVNTDAVPTKTGEEDNSGGNEDVPNETTSVADSPVRLMDSDPLAFHVLPSAVTADAIAVLRKYYHMLLANLHDDHVTTVSILSESVPLDEVFFNEIISFTDHNIANEKMLNAIIMAISSDTDLRGFAQLVKNLVRIECRFSREMLQLEIESLNVEEKAVKRKSLEDTSSVAATTSIPGSTNLGAAVVPVTRYDEPRILHHLPLGLSAECRLVLKKYYNFLWKSFPEDHLIAHRKFSRTITRLDAEITNSIISAPTPQRGNQIMLDIAMIGVSKDRALMELYYLVEEIIDNPKLSKIMKVFKNECQKAVDTCLARIPTPVSMVNITRTTQSTSQVTVTSSAGNFKPGVVDAHTTQEVKSEGDTVEATEVADAEIFTKLPAHQLSDKGIAVLKKHYNILLKSLPGDHMVTLGRLCNVIPVDDEKLDEIIAGTDSPVANKKMLDLLILLIKNDNNLLDFCNSLEKILQDMPTVLGPLRSDCSKVIETAEEAPVVPVTVNDTPMAVTAPQQLSSLVPSSNVPTTVNTGGDQSSNIDIMNVFSHIPSNLLSPKGRAILKKYYLPLWRALPVDYMTSLAKISAQLPLRDDAINLITHQTSSIGANKSILDILITFRGYDDDLMEFCSILEAVIQDEQKVAQVVEPLRQECLQLMIDSHTSPTLPHPIPSLANNVVSSSGTCQTTSSHTATITETTPVKATTASQQNASMTVENTRAALRTFDEHLHLMTLIEPCCIQDSLQTSGLVPNGDLFTATPSLSGSTVMDDVLKEVRSCIEHNGAEKFLVFINVLQTEGRYVLLGCHIFNKYRSYGGQESSTIRIESLLSGLSTLPIQQLLEQLRWHQKQLLAGLQYQCPLPLPDYYLQRDQLLEAIVNKLTENDSTPTVGTTVTITGVGGIGKSTLAKALCHDLQLRNYFLDGFLVIRLGPIPLSPAIKLGQLYHQLTNKTDVGSQTFFTDKLQGLVANHLHKLLVIIDDVWEVSDALVYTQVFNGCKIVMTTRRENVNKLIPSKMCVTIERMGEEEAIKLLTYNLPGQAPSEDISRLAQNLHCWPLLLKLVHGQLSVCISEQHKSLAQSIDQVEEALKGKGLNAADVDKRRSAVMAVAECSIAMLSSDEMYTLQKLVLSAGFSMPVPVPLLPAMLKASSDDIEKLCGRLLQLGLISRCQFITAPNNKTIPCYEVHLIIAQYVMDHMTFGSPVQLVDALDLGDINVISTVLAGGDDSNVSYHCLATVTAIDAIVLPNHIRSLFTLIKCLQHEITNCILQLSVLFIRGNRMDLAQLAMNFKQSDAVKCVEKLHQSIREDCKTLQDLLVNDRHEQAVDWITGYVKNHPLRKTLATFTVFVKDLLHKCQTDSSLISTIKSHTDKIVLFYKTTLQKRSEHVKVTLRRGLVAMINSGNITAEQYKHLLDVYSTNLKLATGNV